MLLAEMRESGPQRLGWIVPLSGFIGGSASYVLVQRDSELAPFFAAALLGGWIWLCLQSSIRHKFDKLAGMRIDMAGTNLAIRAVQQSILFFSLPFFVLATQPLDPGQVFVTGAVVLSALATTIDAVYLKFISSRQLPFVTFHCLCSFVAGLVVLPVVITIPPEETFTAALMLVLFWLVMGAPLNRHHNELSIRNFLLALSFPLLVWSLKDHIPPTGMLVENSVLTNAVTNHKPDRILSEISLAQLSEGLYLFSSIKAPLGLSREVIFDWRHGQHSHEIASTITGADGEGYSAYALKQESMPDAAGHWTVDILTSERQLLDRVEFEVIPEPVYSASFTAPRAAFSMPRVTGLVIKPSM